MNATNTNWLLLLSIAWRGGIILLILYSLYRAYRKRNIDKGLDKLIADGAVILDVRTQPEFNGGHIKQAINIPLSKLRKDFTQLGKDQPIITYCSHGLRSVKAKNVLKARGFINVYNGGGMSDLKKMM